MRKLRPVPLLLGVIGLGVGVVAVFALREATLSTHEEVDARETEVLVSAKTKGGEKSQRLPEMVEAQLLTCRLEVASDFAGPIERLDDRRFRAVLVPALDETNQRQFRGCVEDWIVDHLQVDVIELTDVR
ncbi:MAG TPA: hypothetical protein VF152_03635 [Acidimicrobiia bacterium]